MKSMKKVMIMGIAGVLTILPMNAESASCANGAGIEIKGNDHGTYCRSAIGMNWWSAHAWCDAIGMKLVPMEECNCNDESKCDMTKQCPNLYNAGNVWVWTTTPSGNTAAYYLTLGNGNVHTGTRLASSNDRYALCMS
ncbi:MAG: hypothetical protein IJO11_08015 [Alphaproteobacteria bacterium]|nr:hypothetical protein [Alphaproteobacteria bacterium]